MAFRLIATVAAMTQLIMVWNTSSTAAESVNEGRYIQIKSFENMHQVEAFIRSFPFPVDAYSSASGWFAITMKEQISKDNADTLLRFLKSQHIVPEDAYLTTGRNYLRKVCCNHNVVESDKGKISPAVVAPLKNGGAKGSCAVVNQNIPGGYLNLRESPSTDTTVIAKLMPKDIIVFSDRQECVSNSGVPSSCNTAEWISIESAFRMSNGEYQIKELVGWVFRDFITQIPCLDIKDNSSLPPKNESLQKVADVGSRGLIQEFADDGVTWVSPDIVSIQWGEDSGPYAKDGKCNDPRFTGSGMAAQLSKEYLKSDATDCETLYAAQRIDPLLPPPTKQSKQLFPDDEGISPNSPGNVAKEDIDVASGQEIAREQPSAQDMPQKRAQEDIVGESCKRVLKNKFEWDRVDQYGTKISSRINYLSVHPAQLKSHHIYNGNPYRIAIIHVIKKENDIYKGRTSAQFHCVYDGSTNNILGVEFSK